MRSARIEARGGTPKLDEYMRIREAATYVGVAPNTLRNWEAAGKITAYRHPVNNYRLFKRRDLDELLQRAEQSGDQATRNAPRRPR